MNTERIYLVFFLYSFYFVIKKKKIIFFSMSQFSILQMRLCLKSHTSFSKYFWIDNYFTTAKKYVLYSMNVCSMYEWNPHVLHSPCHYHVTYQRLLRRFTVIYKSCPVYPWDTTVSVIYSLHFRILPEEVHPWMVLA